MKAVMRRFDDRPLLYKFKEHFAFATVSDIEQGFATQWKYFSGERFPLF